MNTSGSRVPHAVIVTAFCTVAVAGYIACSYWVVQIGNDAALRGDTIGTWKSFATLAFGFWIGASSGGKARDASAPQNSPAVTPSEEPLLLDTLAPDQQRQ